MVKTVLQCPFHFRLPFYRFVFVFHFPFRLPFGRFTQMKKGSEYAERISICTLGTSLYTRYSSGEVYRSAGTVATEERLRMGEWHAFNRGVLCMQVTRVTAGTQLCALLRSKISALKARSASLTYCK